jgi:hypothetical protein
MTAWYTFLHLALFIQRLEYAVSNASCVTGGAPSERCPQKFGAAHSLLSLAGNLLNYCTAQQIRFPDSFSPFQFNNPFFLLVQ